MVEQVAERLLITGATGFVGRRLVDLIAQRRPDWSVEALADPGQRFDITNAEQVAAAVARCRPTIVVNLAAVSAVTAAAQDPRLAWRVNLDGVLNLVDALRTHAPEALLLQVSTAEVYGRSFQSGVLIDETALLQPSNAYAASKAAADILVRQSAEAGLKTLVLRPFNHIGPGQANLFVIPAFASQIARIELELQPPVLKVGSLDDERDFLDLDDVIDAYLAVIDARASLAPGTVFNVASGRPRRIGDMLERLVSLTSAKIKVEVDASRLRGGAPTSYGGDASRLREAVGWTPRRDVLDTVARILDFERAALDAPLSVQR